MQKVAKLRTETHIPQPSRRAFVVFLMFNDSYLAGALMVAWGLIKQGSQSRRVCVVTPEITHKARRMLLVLFDQVVEVDPVGIPEHPHTAGQTHIRTGSARLTGAALTRFSSLRLGRDGDLNCEYEKVIVVDADLLPIRDYEQLWELPAPAGIINERREHMANFSTSGQLAPPPKSAQEGRWIWHEIYENVCPHGSPIPSALTNRVAEDYSNYGVNASLVIVEPSMKEFERVLNWVSNPKIHPLVADKWAWVDQQAATLFWSGKWTSIDVSYSMLYGYPSIDVARGFHYAGVKPWSWRKKGFERRLHRFADYRLWSETYLEMVAQFPELTQHGSLRKLTRALEKVQL